MNRDFDIQIFERGKYPHHWVLSENKFTQKATISKRGIYVHSDDYPDEFLRFDYKKMRGKFRDSNVYMINIVDVDGKIWKSYYTKLITVERKILWYSFFKQKFKKGIRQTFVKTWELVTKHFMKILLIAFLTWFSMYGIKFFGEVFDKLNFKDLIETVKDSE